LKKFLQNKNEINKLKEEEKEVRCAKLDGKSDEI
jgi:hypothetical protein